MPVPQQDPAREFPRLYVPPEGDGYAELFADWETPPTTLPFAARGEPPVSATVATTGAFGPQYLVLLQGASQDVPLGLFEDRDEAVEFAREVHANPEAHAERFFAVTRCPALFSQPRWLAVLIVEFAGPVPTASTVLFEF